MKGRTGEPEEKGGRGQSRLAHWTQDEEPKEGTAGGRGT